MATSRTLGTVVTLPTFSRTAAFSVAGDDMSQQRLSVDPDVLTDAMRNASAVSPATPDLAFQIGEADIIIAGNHRPLGQKGHNKPGVKTRLKFLQADGSVKLLTCEINFSVDNMLQAHTVDPSTGAIGDYSASSDLVAMAGEAALALSLNAMLNPTGSASSTRAALKLLFRGIVDGAA